MLAALAAVVLVPIAGAAEPPLGWWSAAVTALAILMSLLVLGDRARWGWLLVVSGVAALMLPRGPFGAIGPALAVATGLCLVVWLFNRRSGSSRDRGRPRAGSPEREAQLRMGLYGERQVGQVLARELPPEFVLINGLKLPRGAGDIDHLVVGPTGVFLLES
jgi:hypothetical protein